MRLVVLALGIVLTISSLITSCDKVENPIKPEILLDTTLYPGNWEDYVFPTFTQNTNTDRNVLIEDYTGHRCPNCPEAAWLAYGLEVSNPGRVFVSSVHAGPNGLSSFQTTAPDCGQPTNPNDEFCSIFYCDEGLEYGQTFGGGGLGFIGNPQGNINRGTTNGSDMFLFSNDWTNRTNAVLTENNLTVNIQAESNYYPETNGFFLHTETEFVQDLSGGQYNIVVSLMENEVKDYQDSLGTKLYDYKHHNIFRGCIDDLAWGQDLGGNYTPGTKVYKDYSYKLPDGQTNEEYHLLIYVFDVDTYEVLQVIRQDL
jgi:hypothetical protein